METFDITQIVGRQSSARVRAAHEHSSSAITSERGSLLRHALVLTLALACVGIATQTPAANQQQERMKTCSAQAKSQSLSGAERQDYMKRCLRGEHVASAQGLNSQQRKMRNCSAEAKSKRLTGLDRNAFVRECLKSPHAR